jgi:CRP-like cAMP-binding protein
MKESKDRDELQGYLAAYRLKAVFPEQMMPHLSLYHFNRGELICAQGDTPEQLYVLVKGKIKIYTTSILGKALILSFKTPLEVIGDIEYIQHIDIINTVEAVTPVTMIGIPQRKMKEHGSHAPFLQFLLDIITRKFALKTNFLRFSLMYPVEVRLASYLLSISNDEADREAPPIRMNLTDVANLIGTTYRHLNRIIADLCTQGLIERSKGALTILNREGLQQLAQDNIYEE